MRENRAGRAVEVEVDARSPGICSIKYPHLPRPQIRHTAHNEHQMHPHLSPYMQYGPKPNLRGLVSCFFLHQTPTPARSSHFHLPRLQWLHQPLPTGYKYMPNQPSLLPCWYRTSALDIWLLGVNLPPPRDLSICPSHTFNHHIPLIQLGVSTQSTSHFYP